MLRALFVLWIGNLLLLCAIVLVKDVLVGVEDRFSHPASDVLAILRIVFVANSSLVFSVSVLICIKRGAAIGSLVSAAASATLVAWYLFWLMCNLFPSSYHRWSLPVPP